eukprot:2536682-Amphidinium_carterae.2
MDENHSMPVQTGHSIASGVGWTSVRWEFITYFPLPDTLSYMQHQRHQVCRGWVLACNSHVIWSPIPFHLNATGFKRRLWYRKYSSATYYERADTCHAAPWTLTGSCLQRSGNDF